MKLTDFLNGQFLFHGSGRPGLAILKPRQAFSFGVPDGIPCVHAASDLEPAIFMAVLGNHKVGGWGKSGLPGYGFYIVKDDLEKARRENWSGSVYVIGKSDFRLKEGREWISYKQVKPLHELKIGVKDLPKNIQVLSKEEFNQYYDSERQLRK